MTTPIDTTDLNYRSLPILISYLLLALVLTASIIRTMYPRYRYLSSQSQAQVREQQWHSWRRHVAVFTALAALSLGFTWCYMFSFFAYSYHDWACERGIVPDVVDVRKLEMWLRDTKLFKEAWETVSETPQRFWWSGQIFLWTVGWSLFLGVMGRRYSIPHVWTYMLLGQIVAISFAQSLFYLAVLLYRPVAASKKRNSQALWTPHPSLEVLPLMISLLSTAIVPYIPHTPYFLPVLIVPHLLLFIPAILNPRILPKGLGTVHRSSEAATKRYIAIFKWLLGIALLLHAKATYLMLTDNSLVPLRRAADSCAFEKSQGMSSGPWERLIGTIFEHPAVSSVSWDVVFCTVEFVSWAAIHGFSAKQILGEAAVESGDMREKDE